MSSVSAKLNFVRRGADGAPPRINKTGRDDHTIETLTVDTVPTAIEDFRSWSSAPSVERNGFTLVHHDTSVDFEDLSQVEGTYYGEVEALCCKVLGCERAIVFDHTIRKVAASQGPSGVGVAARGSSVTAPVNRVHGDYTAQGGPKRVQAMSQPTASGSWVEPPLSEAQAEEIVKGRRYAIVNVWRSISRTAPVARMPLAMLDCSTTTPEDYFKVELIFEDRVGENYSVEPKSSHRWGFYSQMQFNEALLFQTFGSDSGNFTMHTAFDDPRTRAEDPRRESIEVRVLCIYPAEPTSKL